MGATKRQKELAEKKIRDARNKRNSEATEKFTGLLDMLTPDAFKKDKDKKKKKPKKEVDLGLNKSKVKKFMDSRK